MVGKVLVVDDEDTLRLTIKARLNSGGFETDAAVDGEEAIEKLKHTKFDVVLLDINMPRMDGITALGVISEMSPETDVIMLTGFADFSTAIECLKKGAKDYLVKPIDTTELITRLRSLLRARNSEAALDSVNREHTGFVFDNVVGPVVRISEALAQLTKGHVGKLTKEQSGLLADVEELTKDVIATSLKKTDSSFLGVGQKTETQKEVALERIFDGALGLATSLAKAKDVDFKSDLKGKLPKISGDERRLRRAFASLAVAAVGMSAKGGKVTVGFKKATDDDHVEITAVVSKVGDKGQKSADFLAKPIESLGGQLQKLDNDSLLFFSAQRIIKEHGGTLSVKSSKGELQFVCTIPKRGNS